MTASNKPKKYSCLKCGSPFDAYPPDDQHDTATRSETYFKDSIKVQYRCKDCGNENILYWGHDYLGGGGVSPFIATF